VARHDAGSMIVPNVGVGLHNIYIYRIDFQETSLLHRNRPPLALPTKLLLTLPTKTTHPLCVDLA
jgi:hypothetical protein